MKGRSWRASIHRAPQPRGSVRARFEIAVERQLGCVVSACGQRLFRPDAMLRRTDVEHRVPTVGGTANLSGSKVEPWLRR
jgi:hypothetical protein